MAIETLARQARQMMAQRPLEEPHKVGVMPGLVLLAHQRTTIFEAALYEPVMCLILQGAKETTFGGQSYAASAGDCLLVSHDVSVVSRVIDAPYLALLLGVDVPILRGLYDELGRATLDGTPARAMEVQRADAQLVGAIERYLGLAASPREAEVLGPLVRKEIHYRLLTASFGGMLRKLVRHDSHASAIARATAHIRRDLRAAIAIPDLARQVGMSPSSFHKHFKAVTASTPLQYQKDLRLLAARHLLVTGAASVTTAAYEVGYESPSQFSREYSRKFGRPPSQEHASTLLARSAPQGRRSAAAPT